MSRMNKVVSSIVLVCFLLNTVASDLAFGLATPLASSDIAGIQYKDMGRIKFALEEQLVALGHSGMSVSMGTFTTILKEQKHRELTIFQPADMQFFFRETTLTNIGPCVRVRLKDKYGARDYYAVFSLQEDTQDGFPITVYTEEQYNALSAFVKGKPQIRPEDASEVDRYAQHERFDAILNWAHNNGAAAKLLAENLNYDDVFPSPEALKRLRGINATSSPAEASNLARLTAFFRRILNITITNPHDRQMVPNIEDRQFWLVNIDTARKMPGFNEKDLQTSFMLEGVAHSISISAHSSNGAIHILLGKKDFEILTVPSKDFIEANSTPEDRDHYATFQYHDELKTAYRKVLLFLVHELGAMTGMPQIDAEGRNGLDVRAQYVGSEAAVATETLNLTVANLDHVKGRDYAAGDIAFGSALVAEDLLRFAMDKNYKITIPDLNAFLHKAFVNGKIVFSTDEELRNAENQTHKRLVGAVSAESLFRFAAGLYPVPVQDIDKFLKGALVKGIIVFATDKDREEHPGFENAPTVESLKRLAVELYASKDDHSGKSSRPLRISDFNAFLEEALLRANIEFRSDEDAEKAGVPGARKVSVESLMRLALETSKIRVPDLKKFLQKAQTNGLIYFDTREQLEKLQAAAQQPKTGPGGNLNAEQLTAMVANKATTAQQLIDYLMQNAGFEQEMLIRGLLNGDARLAEFDRLLAKAKETIALTNELSKLEAGRRHISIDRTMFMLGTDGTLTATTWSESGAPSSFEYSLDSEGQLTITKKTLDEEGKEDPVKPAHLSIPINAAIRNVLIAHLPPKAAAPVTAAPAGNPTIDYITSAPVRDLVEKAIAGGARVTVNIQEALQAMSELDGGKKLAEFNKALAASLAPVAVKTQSEDRVEVTFEQPHSSDPEQNIVLGVTVSIQGKKVEFDNFSEASSIAEGLDKLLAAGLQLPVKVGYDGESTIIFKVSGMEVGRIETPIYEEANGVMFKMLLYKVFSLASRAKRGEAVAWEEISAMLTLTLGSVQQIRQEIPTHPSDRYNLLVPYEFFANGELEKHRAKYGDRFDIDWVSGPSPEIFITNVRAKASGRETKTVVLVPSYLPTKQLEELTKIGIRFVRVNTRELLSARSDKPEDRERFQVDTYAMMILLRRVDDSITAESSIYRLLSFYLRTHFNFSDKIAIDDYIQAITKSDIGKLILGILAYRPAKAYDVPEYKNVAASLISA